MYALIEWLEDPPKWDVVPIKQFVKINGEDSRCRKATPGDQVELRFQGQMAAAVIKDIGMDSVAFVCFSQKAIYETLKAPYRVNCSPFPEQGRSPNSQLSSAIFAPIL